MFSGMLLHMYKSYSYKRQKETVVLTTLQPWDLSGVDASGQGLIFV